MERERALLSLSELTAQTGGTVGTEQVFELRRAQAELAVSVGGLGQTREVGRRFSPTARRW